MRADFDIVTDRTNNLVKVKLSGFFTVKDVARFSIAYRDALRHVANHGHVTLADIRDMAIQAQDIVAAFSDFMASPAIRSRKLAFVCGSTLARLQAQRLTARDNVQFFQSALLAETWLLE